jgi:EAL domain-containing protein (putative c-di-GMP-specific phosphodiesterase class I)
MVETFAGQGIRTVFEGIEEGWQLELAERSGASMVQGYVLARPEIVPTRFGVFREAAAAAAAADAPARVSAETPRHAAAPTAMPVAGMHHADPPAFRTRPGKAFGRRGAGS